MEMKTRPPRICLVTPGHVSTNPRLVKEADALTAAGCEVTVAAADYLRWAREADLEFASRPWRAAERTPFGPLAPFPARLKQGVRQRLAQRLLKAGASAELLENAAWHPAVPELAAAASKIAADLYIAHYPAALPAAAKAARMHGGRYAFDAEDFHLGDVPEGPAHDFTRRLTRAIEGRYLPGAAYVSAASPDIAGAYAEAYGVATPTVILNVFPAAEAPPAPTPRGTARPGPSLYWFSQTIGPDRGLECAVEAIARAASQPNLFLLGAPAAGYRERLSGFAQTLGCAERLHFLPPAPPSQMAFLAAGFDVGLASEIGHTPNNRLALSNKLFTYLLAGLPVVLSDTLAQARFAAEAPACLRLYPRGEPEALAVELDRLLLDPAQLCAARAAAFELGRARYNWECESRALVDLVRRSLAPQDGAARGAEQCA